MNSKSLRSVVLIAALAFGLPGCSGKSVLEGGTSLTASIQNPVGEVNIYQTRTAYAVGLELAVGYREYCYSKPYRALMADPIAAPVCRNRRQYVRAAQAADDRAFDAITKAEKFIRDNPTLSAVTVLRAAYRAASDFQSVATRTPAVPR